MLTLYRKRYGGFTAKHFHEKMRQHHGFALGYSWTRLRLQATGLIAKAPRRFGAPGKYANNRQPFRSVRHPSNGGRALPDLAATSGNCSSNTWAMRACSCLRRLLSRLLYVASWTKASLNV